MALNWDCSPAKSCYDLGRARYTADGHAATATKTQDDYAIDHAVQRAAKPQNKVRFGWQQHSSDDRSNSPVKDMNAQDVCSYPASALGPPFAPPRYHFITTSEVESYPSLRWPRPYRKVYCNGLVSVCPSVCLSCQHTHRVSPRAACDAAAYVSNRQ